MWILINCEWRRLVYSEKDTNVTGYRPNTQQLATIQDTKTVPVKMFLLSNCCMYKVFSYCLSYVLCETLPFSLFLFFCTNRSSMHMFVSQYSHWEPFLGPWGILNQIRYWGGPDGVTPGTSGGAHFCSRSYLGTFRMLQRTDDTNDQMITHLMTN